MMIAPNFPIDVPRDELKGKIMEESYPQYHYNEGDDTYYPRPSGFLKLDPSSLFQKVHWGDCDEDFLKAVRIRTSEGHKVHAAIQAILENRKLPNVENAQVQTKIDRFQNWKKQYKLRQYGEPDKTIISPKLGFGGTPDLICRLDYEQNSVIDFKIGRKLHDVYWLQLESYAQLIEEEMNITIGKLHVLFLGAKNKPGFTLKSQPRTEELTYRVKQLINEWYTMFPRSFKPSLHAPSRMEDISSQRRQLSI